MLIKITNSPFDEKQAELLNKLLPSLSDSQKMWLSGYLTALQPQAPEQFIANVPSKEVTILYGSQTGNAQGLAKKAAKDLEANGFNIKLYSMNEYKPNQLKKTKTLLIIVSTHGEGDPPDNALPFYEFIHSKRIGKVDNLQYSVLALGDSSYEHFCQTGKDFDHRLAELGAKRLYPRFDCDLDFEEPAAEWLKGVIEQLQKETDIVSASIPNISTSSAASVQYSRNKPFQAEVLENINLNGRGSNKETRHLELSLEGSNLTYQPGDCLGIYPENDPSLVEVILQRLTWSADQTVSINKEGDILSLKEALSSHFEITVLTKPLIEKAAQQLNNNHLNELLNDQDKLLAYIKGRDLLDFIEDFGVWGDSAQQFVSVLRKIPPRLYSISSSLLANPDEVHVTIGAVQYYAHGRLRKGVCSNYCANRLAPGETASIFIQENENFRLPADPDTPIIMIGPGTGIAPFRAFMQEREEIGAKGKSWLFFGEQHFMTDFLYQTEWRKWLQDGVLTKMDVAFSRDTKSKIYVQHRMQEKSKELYRWLEEGATIYVCGDGQKMAPDAHQTLIDIIAKEGSMSHDKALEYVSTLQQTKRYLRDVY